MENAADALKIAAAILIFIIAISSSFSLFGTAKHTADSIILMEDKQEYLEAAELDNGILYTSTESIASENITGINKNGDRIVNIDDVVSTIHRYSKEKYAVTIMKEDGTVLTRFDSSTENIMRQWYNITDTETATAQEQKNEYIDRIKKNLVTKKYCQNYEDIDLDLEEIYKITVEGNSKIKCGAPWYGNDDEIQKRIMKNLYGGDYSYNGQKYEINIGLIEQLHEKTIVEVTNEIDNSKYLEDGEEKTNLLQQYNMPTVEIIYIILD